MRAPSPRRSRTTEQDSRSSQLEYALCYAQDTSNEISKKKKEREVQLLSRDSTHKKKTASLMKPEVSSSSTREKNTKNKACPQSTNKTKNGSSTVVHAVKQWFNQKSTKQTL